MLADGMGMARASNGVYYLPYSTNAFVSGKVTQEIDLGTHTLFIADVTEARVLSGAPSMTSSFNFANVKPKPAALTKQTGWVCKICGYVYEGDTLPADFICPQFKHGAEELEKLQDCRRRTTDRKDRSSCPVYWNIWNRRRYFISLKT